MLLQIITIYCLCDEYLKASGYKDDLQAQMTTAEVMTTALIAVWYFSGNQEMARVFLQEHGYIPKMLSKSRFNRRLHAIEEVVWQGLFYLLAEIHQQTNSETSTWWTVVRFRCVIICVSAAANSIAAKIFAGIVPVRNAISMVSKPI